MAEQQTATARNQRALVATFILTFSFAIVEVIGGLLSNSLALLADAAHMLTDVGGLALALFAAWITRKPATPARTYGYYRVEILAALANALVLLLMSIFILYEAYHRFWEPPEVKGWPMLAIAAVGLVVNLIGIWNLHSGAQESLNIHGAFLEVVSDTLGSVATIVAAIILLTTGWTYADPLFSGLIGLFILPRTWQLLMQAVHVLLEGAPAHINVAAVEQALLRVQGVARVHDLHVWTITSGIDALSVHVEVTAECDAEPALALVGVLARQLKEQFAIDHSTIQIERPNCCVKEMAL